MPRSAAPEPQGWLRLALGGVLGITALRIVLLAFNRTDLFVDEAQYWLWGQDLSFGYYSKPPLIAWVIRAVTAMAGSDAPFWVRLPAPLFHAATALILGGIAARLCGARAAVVTALGFVTLPMVALGSLLISTDTIMFPFLAAALAFWLGLLRRPGPLPALLAGAAVGLAALAKYAAVYYLLCAGLAALLLPGARPSLRHAGLALLAFFVTVSPNIAWNVANGLSTLEHTLDNANWVRDPGARADLNPGGLLEFLAAQFIVFGPVLFGALMVMAWRWRRLARPWPMLLLFCLPIVAAVCVQALLSFAYANWAASAYLAGSLCALPWLLGQRRAWLVTSFAINGAFCLALPLSTLAPDRLRLAGGPLLLERYVGRTQMSEDILTLADEAGLDIIVASDRDVLADLFYTGRYHPAMVYALPPEGRASHHYVLKFPYLGGTEPLLLVIRSSESVPCPNTAREFGRIAPDTGAYRRHPQTAYMVPGDCFEADRQSPDMP